MRSSFGPVVGAFLVALIKLVCFLPWLPFYLYDFVCDVMPLIKVDGGAVL